MTKIERLKKDFDALMANMAEVAAQNTAPADDFPVIERGFKYKTGFSTGALLSAIKYI